MKGLVLKFNHRKKHQELNTEHLSTYCVNIELNENPRNDDQHIYNQSVLVAQTQSTAQRPPQSKLLKASKDLDLHFFFRSDIQERQRRSFLLSPFASRSQ